MAMTMANLTALLLLCSCNAAGAKRARLMECTEASATPFRMMRRVLLTTTCNHMHAIHAVSKIH